MEPTGNAFDIAAAATVAREGWTSDADQSELYAMLFDGAGGDGTDGDVAQAWKRILSKVQSYSDLEPAFLGRVEELIDFVTAP